MPESSIDEILSNSKEVKKVVSQGVPKDEAVRVAKNSEKKVESGEWEELFHKVSYSHNDSYPQALSIIRYWGPKAKIISHLVSSPERKEYAAYDLIKTFDSETGRIDSGEFKNRSIYMQDQFIVRSTGEILNFDELKQMVKSGKIDPSEKLVKISSHKMSDLAKMGELGITHELSIGQEMPGENYAIKSIFFEMLPKEQQTPSNVMEIYRSFGFRISPKEAEEKLLEYLHGNKDRIITRYCAREKVKKLFRDYERKDISDSKADQLIRKYESMGQKEHEGGKKYSWGSARPLHRHWEIKQMYEAQNARNNNAGNNKKKLESIVCALLFVLAALNFAKAGLSITGNAVFAIPKAGSQPVSNLALGFLLLVMAITVLVIILEDRKI
ncbi:hypothetical protein COT07_02290 [Candidatus Woesearchaeota archaeon CG07_land_8_20_14_0_80_44_23]|nr:MAG: hypothetical protein COT07_02290 [Candidatus Woesearchaeota archaeon CG07_land_8_20_14_0_80_44_23]